MPDDVRDWLEVFYRREGRATYDSVKEHNFIGCEAGG
jgi:hypothetical protein